MSDAAAVKPAETPAAEGEWEHEYCYTKGRPPIEHRYDTAIRSIVLRNNRSYPHPRSKSNRLGVELYSAPLKF